MTVNVMLGVADGNRERLEVTLSDTLLLPDRDATVAVTLGVDPTGAQNGPMLNVARCVPLSDDKGLPVFLDAEGDVDVKPVTICKEGAGDERRAQSSAEVQRRGGLSRGEDTEGSREKERRRKREAKATER